MKLFLGLMAALPERIAYGLAAVAYLLLFRVFRYRRSTVQENLRFAFPEKSQLERGHIEAAFYRHLCNLFVEILRSTRMTQEQLAERMRFKNLEVLVDATHNYEQQAIILLIHQSNWEWMLHGSMAQLPVSVDPVYKALHSAFWDDYMLQARSRFGAVPMTIESVGREVIRGRKRKRVIAMLADQAGPKHGGFWTEFLGRPASFYRGADKLAQALKIPVIFAQCRRVSRGHYEIELHEVSRPPHPTDGEEILEAYVRLTEQVIAEQPETYLWTNRRWKKAPPEDYRPASPTKSTAPNDATESATPDSQA